MARAKSKPRGKKKTKTAATTPTVTTSPPPTAVSSINANAKPISMNLADGKGYCFESGIRFHPPHTHNTLALLMKLWIPSSFVAVVLMGLLLWYGMSISFVIKMIDPYFPGTSTWLINNGAGTLTNRQVLYFAIFWRLMYNVFLGLMLRLQSDTKFLTRFIQYVSTQGRNSFLYKIINFLLKGTAGCHDPLHEYPAGFNAWLLNMQVVNIILPLDVLAFMVVVFRHSFVASDCAAWFMSSNTGQSFMLETPEWFCAGASYTATGFGIILGLIYLYSYSGGIKNICIFIVIVMSVKLTFYYFYPKSDYMLYHLQTKEQVKAWTDVYKSYKNAWKYSLIVSFISYILISYGLNNY